ncbi:EAL domain-containing protein [Shewanella sp.]|nr:EAL domain-containing protein [Shewanella sp.]
MLKQRLMQMNRLQIRIFFFFMLLLLAVQAISFTMSYQNNQRLTLQQLSNRLSIAELVFNSEYENRNYYLSAFAETAAKDFALKDIFIDGDSRSFLVALNNHQKRINADLAIAVSAQGQVIGQLVSFVDDNGRKKVRLGIEHNTAFRYPLATEFQQISTLYALEDKVYQIKFAPLTSGGDSVIAWVGFGFAVDDNLAQSLQSLTGLNTGFIVTQPEHPSRFLDHHGSQENSAETAVIKALVEGEHTNEDYLLWSKKVGVMGEASLYAYMYQPRSDLLHTFQQQWLWQLALIMLMLPLTMLLAFLIAGSVTKPIKQLIEQARFIAKGNYNSKVSVGNSVEMLQLAEEFTVMQQAILSRESEIAFQAYHDPLTRLPNRNELERVCAAWFAQQQNVAICLINIRRMGEVNVTLGHVVGDEVLKEIARRLTLMANIDLVCRLSGDEFVLAFKNTNAQTLTPLLTELHRNIEQPYQYQEINLHLQITIGCAFYRPPCDLVTLLRQTDIALHYAKSHQLSQQTYDASIDVNTLERLQLVNDLKSAIETHELVLFYQPKLDLKLNQVTHVEALVRWMHPMRGMISPDTFIPIAEKTGQMNALTRWVIIEAISQYHRWRQEGITLSIAVNISAENLKDEFFCQWVLDIIKQHNMPISALTLEITEDAVVADPATAIRQLSVLRQYGLALSIDDYGTGYSSLTQLKRLPVDELKIDRTFVQQLMNSGDDRIIVSSTLQLAHSLGLSVVAEGVEDQATLNWLTERGCEMAQGFYLSKPMEASLMGAWLAQYNNISRDER